MSPARALAAIALAALLAGCAPVFPPIAAAVPGDAAFKAQIATRYPPGSSGARLREDLAREDFVLLETGSPRWVARSVGDNLPCHSEVRVIWTEDRRGRIRAIGAERHDCS